MNIEKIISIQYGFSDGCRLIWILHINFKMISLEECTINQFTKCQNILFFFMDLLFKIRDQCFYAVIQISSIYSVKTLNVVKEQLITEDVKASAASNLIN